MSGPPNREAATPKPLMNAKSKPACSMSFALRPSWQQGPCIFICLEGPPRSQARVVYLLQNIALALKERVLPMYLRL